MSIIKMTRRSCPDLADFLEGCCNAPFNFDGDHPIQHSSHNHIHLWALEWWADHHSWIDLDYRMEFVEEIFKRWRVRMKGLKPYQDQGYRLYLYEDTASTVSIVAETAVGFPYSGDPTFVEQRRDIMELYLGRSWQSNFQLEPFEIDQKVLLDKIDKNSGSIGKPTADALGVKVGALRTLIEQMDLQTNVNAIRKKYKRRPANFRGEEYLHRYRIHEQIVQPGYA